MKFSLTGILHWTFGLRYFHPDGLLDGVTAIPFVWDKGSPRSRLALIQGENAGGKSLFRRFIQVFCSKGEKYPVQEVIHLSMESRCGGIGGSAIARGFIYGDESWRATSSNTANTIEGSINTATGRDHPVVVYWDEPDIGMSARSAAGAGVRIAQWVDNLPEHVLAVFVTSHSPHLIHQLLRVKLKPHYICLGSEAAPPTAEAWVQAQMALDVEPILPVTVLETGQLRFKRIQKIQSDK